MPFETYFASIVPTMDTGIYANGELWFDTTACDFGVNMSDGSCFITDISILDRDDQAAAIYDIFVLDAANSLGTLNGAVTITDVLAASVIGRVRFDGTATAPEIVADLGPSKFYQKTSGNVGIPMLVHPQSATPTQLFFAGVVVTGTPTQTAAGITLRVGISKRL